MLFPSTTVSKKYNPITTTGERIFAENRTAELVSKVAALPKDIAWHYIGHLQRNKVKDILPIVSCIQSLDNIALAKVIEKEATKRNRTVDVLIELHLADEDTNKSGLDPADVEIFTNFLLQECPHIKIQGLMTMGPHTDDEVRIHEVFTKAQEIFKTSSRTIWQTILPYSFYGYES